MKSRTIKNEKLSRLEHRAYRSERAFLRASQISKTANGRQLKSFIHCSTKGAQTK